MSNPTATPTHPIRVSRGQLDRLRTLVEHHLEGRDAAAAERLAGELDRAVVLEVLPREVVQVGSRVRFEDGRARKAREVVLVWPRAADASIGRISVLAPIGAALLGLAVGDTITWPLPGDRETRLRLLAVEPGDAELGPAPAALG